MTVDIPGIGQRVFTIENFSNIVGTNASSRMVGNDRNNSIKTGSGDDVMVGSRGNDIMDGGGGNNTVDYSNLGTAVTIKPRGTIDKGAAGVDKVNNFQKIVGATASNLTGGGGNDTVSGGSGDDIVTGTSEATKGVGEIDTLTGGTGLNTFVLGGAAGFHYVSGGNNDYAQINSFNLLEDTIDIGSATGYDLGLGTNGELNLFADTNGILDLVAKIQLAPETQFAFAAAKSQGASFDAGSNMMMSLAADSPLLPNLKIVSSAGLAIAPISTSVV